MPEGILVTYGSQTGTAQEYAENIYLEGTMKGLRVRLLPLNDFLKV